MHFYDVTQNLLAVIFDYEFEISTSKSFQYVTFIIYTYIGVCNKMSYEYKIFHVFIHQEYVQFSIGSKYLMIYMYNDTVVQISIVRWSSPKPVEKNIIIGNVTNAWQIRFCTLKFPNNQMWVLFFSSACSSCHSQFLLR